MSFARSKGFTIQEVLVVVAIVFALSTIVFGALQGARPEARDEKRRITMPNVELALKLYREKNGVYPPSCGGVYGDSSINFHAVNISKVLCLNFCLHSRTMTRSLMIPRSMGMHT